MCRPPLSAALSSTSALSPVAASTQTCPLVAMLFCFHAHLCGNCIPGWYGAVLDYFSVFVQLENVHVFYLVGFARSLLAHKIPFPGAAPIAPNNHPIAIGNRGEVFAFDIRKGFQPAVHSF